MILSLMVAVSKNFAIGKDNKLLWHLSDDLKNFKNVTLGKPILMGRKTYDSIGRPLPKRENLIVTRNKNFCVDGAFIFNDPKVAIDSHSDKEELVIIGGGHLYSDFIDKVDKMYITHVDCDVDGDTFFPEFNKNEFSIVKSYTHSKDEKNEYSWTFCEYQRI